MHRTIILRGASIALLAWAVAVSYTAIAAHSKQHRVVDGVSIYLGVVPGEIFSGHPKAHPESEMHGGAPPGTHVYHLVIAVFDAVTGQRISDANVMAGITEIEHPAPLRKLEPMQVGGTIAYGNYFDLPGNGPYRIAVRVVRSGMPDIETEFIFGHART